MTIYFLINEGEDIPYLHHVVVLAEGFQKLGIRTFANTNYWKESPGSDYLLQVDASVLPEDCDIIITSSTVDFSTLNEKQVSAFVKSRKKTIFIDGQDGMKTSGYRKPFVQSTLVLKCHYNRKYKYPRNFMPWQFGLTQRIISSVSPVENREEKILVNFRVNHPSRAYAKKKLLPILKEYLEVENTYNPKDEPGNDDPVEMNYRRQAPTRHHASYYKNLSTSLACLCIGGSFKKSIYSGSHTIFRGLSWLDRSDGLLPFIDFDRIVQYDSWRFWESLVAGCCAIHIDLDRYGAELPLNPTNYEHYLGVDFSDLSLTNDFLQNHGLDGLKEIGRKGREWVISNYSPKAVANRLLEKL